MALTSFTLTVALAVGAAATVAPAADGVSGDECAEAYDKCIGEHRFRCDAASDITCCALLECVGDCANQMDADTRADKCSGGGRCFPAAATAYVVGRGATRLDELRVGDRVRVGGGQDSVVHVFSHRDSAAVSAFVRVVVAGGLELVVSPRHYIYVEGGLREAKMVKVGDWVEVQVGEAVEKREVVAVDEVVERGLYNPHTMAGDIVVDGVRASCYTGTVPPLVGHWLLAPLRVVYALTGWVPGFLEKGASARIVSMMESLSGGK
eukprot:CAMPEP_0198312758 /NCGR_PEP_ID=MMETSP1450-20131203/4015_1 /TAXON_ID=753684 ORGANISM="Madagascaria erythrocladiodes, Strain CCMP3234" /NCGR_SAMPLE_ID=MMETSP1450 /ASSEMBLY_ACC=CAM_ASM_001115 /LENGTH=264 /DNA_ID=CAMNT_0044015717 /DNA_START=62 /DNA_END=856 /DNA_ORIENTATION=-